MSTHCLHHERIHGRPPAWTWLYVPLVALMLLLVSQAAAAQARQEQDGVVLYWGLVPAAVVAERHDLGELHGQPSGDGGQVHHLVVALFDKASGKRIEDAVVRAQLSEIGIADAPPKYLTPMRIGALMSYGQLFSVAKAGPYRFRVLVKLADRPAEIEFAVSAYSPHAQPR